jgi:phage-related minor tail protein
VETSLTSYVQPITNIIYIIAAVVGIVGGLKVYSKWTSGDPQAGSAAMGWAAACVFLILVPTIITTLFGVTAQ